MLRERHGTAASGGSITFVGALHATPDKPSDLLTPHRLLTAVVERVEIDRLIDREGVAVEPIGSAANARATTSVHPRVQVAGAEALKLFRSSSRRFDAEMLAGVRDDLSGTPTRHGRRRDNLSRQIATEKVQRFLRNVIFMSPASASMGLPTKRPSSLMPRFKSAADLASNDALNALRRPTGPRLYQGIKMKTNAPRNFFRLGVIASAALIAMQARADTQPATGQYITPLAVSGAVQQYLNPGLPAYPSDLAGRDRPSFELHLCA